MQNQMRYMRYEEVIAISNVESATDTLSRYLVMNVYVESIYLRNNPTICVK